MPIWIALAACACTGNDFEPVAEMAPACANGRLALIEDLQLERDVDYIGDYELGVLVDSKGAPCSGALQAERCAETLELAMQNNEHVRVLITTLGDTARLWTPQSLVSLFGEIDTASEAIYLASSFGYAFDCKTEVTRVAAGFLLTTAGTLGGGCAGIPFPADRLEVTREGVVNDADSGVSVTIGFCDRGGRP
jgi:hypothetical protein